MVVFDTSVLILLLKPNASGPLDPATGQPIEKVREKIELAAEDRSQDLNVLDSYYALGLLP